MDGLLNFIVLAKRSYGTRSVNWIHIADSACVRDGPSRRAAAHASRIPAAAGFPYPRPGISG